ncbi:hypothetical protein ACHAWT_006956 [Skeletonema menzelii]
MNEILKEVQVGAALKVGDACDYVCVKLGLKEHQDDVVTAGRIFVTGAQGVLGYRVAQRLLNAGHPATRIGYRHPDDLSNFAEQLSSKGAEVVHFDWKDKTTYASALDGVKIVFCVTPYTENWAQTFPKFLRACEKAGVEYFVKVSFYHARKENDIYQKVNFVRLHAACDDILSQSSIPYTILSASHLMSNPLVMHHAEDAGKGKEKPIVLYGASDGANINYVSPNDIAEVATRVIMYSKPHMRKEYTLTGLQPISDDDLAYALAKHSKRPVFYEDLPINMLVKKEEDGFTSVDDVDWKVRDFIGLEKLKATGLEEDATFISHDIEKICKRKPETIDDYLQATDLMTPLEKWIFE